MGWFFGSLRSGFEPFPSYGRRRTEVKYYIRDPGGGKTNFSRVR
jgi:hypothetical protein